MIGPGRFRWFCKNSKTGIAGFVLLEEKPYKTTGTLLEERTFLTCSFFKYKEAF